MTRFFDEKPDEIIGIVTHPDEVWILGINMTMQEIIARELAYDAFRRQASIAEQRRGPSAFVEGWWKSYWGTAGAVLKAMRKPTPPVIEGLAQGWLGEGGDKARDYAPEAMAAWIGAIDAAKDGA